MEIKSLRTNLYEIVAGHLRRAAFAARIVKGLMLILGALVAGLAQFMDVKPSGIEGFQILGFVGCTMVFLAGVWSVIYETNTSEELKVAAKTLESAEFFIDSIDSIDFLQEDLDRATNLIVANQLIRAFLDSLCTSSRGTSDDALVKEILKISARYITLSMGLDGGNEWTLCAYKAIPDPNGKDKLKLVAHDRAIDCDMEEARNWEEGVGVTGICYSMGREVIVPQLQSQGIGSLFNVGERSRTYDASRHQSIVAIPIQVDKDERPWGVLTASSDRPDHFAPNEPGLQHVEGARALAGAMALGIAINRRVAHLDVAT